MGIVSVTAAYRPTKLGIVIPKGDIDSLVKFAGINSALWGGIANPILPLCADGTIAFPDDPAVRTIDALIRGTESAEINVYLEKHPYLRSPRNFTSHISEKNNQGKNEFTFLDIISAIDVLWRDRTKHLAKGKKSEFALIGWDSKDELRNVLALEFGYLTDPSIDGGFQVAFEHGLRANVHKLSRTQEIPSALRSQISPIQFTEIDLERFGVPEFSPGLFIGAPENFDDLAAFWYLRSLGTRLSFCPISSTDRFQKYLQEFIGEIEARSNPKHLDLRVTLYHRPDIKSAVLENPRGYFAFAKDPIKTIITPELLAKAGSISFKCRREEAFAVVESQPQSKQVSIALPPLPFTISEHSENQQVMVSLNPYYYDDGDGSAATLHPPHLPELNEFYSRALTFDPWKIRSEPDGLGIFIKASDKRLSLTPINCPALISEIFSKAGIKTEDSQAGLIAQHLSIKLGGVNRSRVFMVRGVRKLFAELGPNESITRARAKQIIFEEDFKRFESLYIRPRKEEKLTNDEVFDFLLESGCFRSGLDLVCPSCRLKNWLPVTRLGDDWTCEYCSHKSLLSLRLANEGTWKYRRSGLFGKDNNQEGAIPTLLSLFALTRMSSASNIFCMAQRLANKEINCETDFVLVRRDFSDITQCVIGECKSQGGEIQEADVANLFSVAECLKKIGVEPYVLFAKTSEGFTREEVSLLKAAPGSRIILFTRRELESWHLYRDVEKKVPHTHGIQLSDLVENSRALYLSP